jgi:hypothetical protein
VRRLDTACALSAPSVPRFLNPASQTSQVGISLRAVSPAHASATLDLALSPSGQLRLAASDGAIEVEPARLARLTQAFERGSGDGLVQLGGAELDGDLPLSLGWFRDFGRLFFTALCALPDLDLPGAVTGPPKAPDFDELAHSAAPMLGGEYLNAAVLESLWGAIWAALSTRAAERQESVIEVVRGLSSAWHGVGRVVFHLAENKRDASTRSRFWPRTRRGCRVLARPSMCRSAKRCASTVALASARLFWRCSCPFSGPRRRANSCGNSSTQAICITRFRGRLLRPIGFCARCRRSSTVACWSECRIGGARGTGRDR